MVEGRPLFLEVLLSKLRGAAALSLVVTDQESGGPVGGAKVLFPELGVSAETSGSGQALISDLPAGQWLVVVSGLGYGTASSFIQFDATTVVQGEVALTEGPVVLSSIARRSMRKTRSAFLIFSWGCRAWVTSRWSRPGMVSRVGGASRASACRAGQERCKAPPDVARAPA